MVNRDVLHGAAPEARDPALFREGKPLATGEVFAPVSVAAGSLA
jgi:hypothetical protein